jgi:single-stranded DNA-binding protein
MASVFSTDSVKSSFPFWNKYSDPAHIKLVQYFTKGKILTIHGNIKIDQWEGKDGTPRAQLRLHKTVDS